jgi:ribosomal-protein-alanine N-acetyltransferase
MTIFAETERFILRELLSSDDTGIFELDSNKDVHRYLGKKPIQNIEEARKVIDFIRQQYVDNGIGRWAIIEKKTNDFVGWTGLKFVREKINNHSDFYDLGYRLIPKFWRQGIATETAKASVDYGLNKLNLNSIYGMADVDNKASINVLQKAGLKFIETFNYEGAECAWLSILK